MMADRFQHNCNFPVGRVGWAHLALVEILQSIDCGSIHSDFWGASRIPTPLRRQFHRSPKTFGRLQFQPDRF